MDKNQRTLSIKSFKMANRAFQIFIVLLFTVTAASAQHKKQNRDLINLNMWKPAGWHFAPGLTYTMPFKPKGDDAPDVNPNGRVALYAEVGRWRMFPGGGNLFNYFDYSLAYKRLSGAEKFEGNKGIFKQNFLLANFNINNMIQLSDYTFIQNSLGANLDFKFLERYDNSGSPIGDNTDRLLFSLHYKFGFGIKVSEKLFIIPSIETPILNIKEFERGRSDYGVFSSRYRPIIFSVRFAFLSKPDRGACPPKPGGDGKNYDEMLKMQ
ncbi:MAG: hypothetical protein ACI8Q1_000673 [Parvicella sp.]|jgi:hypothetical protein